MDVRGARGERAAIDAITAPGAFVMGRSMFGPGRGVWDEEWQGWWGDEPPYHAPVYVLTHHPREPLEMQGGRRPHPSSRSTSGARGSSRM